MGCKSDYLEPTAREKESVKVLGFLKELGFNVPKHDIYGDVDNLDTDTANLCSKCKTIDSMSDFSLELQMWWRDHQILDRKREEARIRIKLTQKVNPNQKTIFIINNKIADNKKSIAKFRADKTSDPQSLKSAIFTLQEVNRNLNWVKGYLLSK